MLPPQAPPAVVSHANQAAVDTLRRLAETQQWLASQQDLLPEPPATGGDIAPFLAELDAFWSAPVDGEPGQASLPRRQSFARRLAGAAYDDASLRANDGTLSDEAFALIHAVVRHPGGALPSHLHADELRLGGASYAGMLIASDDRQANLALLFTVEAGWEAFGSREALFDAVDYRLRRRMAQANGVPGIADDDIRPALDRHLGDTQAIDTSPFTVLADRLIDRYRERVRDTMQRTAFPGIASREDALRHALDLHALLDVHGMVSRRDDALFAKAHAERMGDLPAPVRQDWENAAEAYRRVMRDTATVRRETPLPEPLSPVDFAEDQLRRRLREHHVAAEPGDVRLSVAPLPTSPNGVIAAATDAAAAETLSLTQFAFRNVDATETLTVLGTEGSPSAGTVRAIVRDLDLPNRYAAYLDDILAGPSAEARLNRSLARDLLRARMRFEANDARLVYYRPDDEPRSLIDDHEEQGFAWIRTVLDHPVAAGRPRTARGHELVASQLTYRGAPLADVLLIGVRDPKSSSRVVLYTPNAPDGMAWREFADRAELTRRFLVAPAFKDYLLQRLPDEFVRRDERGERHFTLPTLNGNRSASWVFDLHPCNDCTPMDERFSEQEVGGSVLDTLYDTAIGLAKRNVRHLARSTHLTRVDAVAKGIRTVTTFAGGAAVVSELGEGLVRSIPRTAQAAWRLYEHARAGDPTAAFLDFVDGYTSALNVVPLYGQVPSLLAGSLLRAAPGSTRWVGQRQTLPPADTLFEARFAARGVTLPAGATPIDGIYAANGARYIRQGARTFEVQFDDGIQGWRLKNAGALDARFSGPAIERLLDGQWHFRSVGLRGGSGRGTARLELFGGEDWERIRPRLAADIADFSRQEVVNLQGALARQMPQWDAERLFMALGRQWDAGLPRPFIAMDERAMWEQTVQMVRSQRTPPPGAVAPPAAGTSAASWLFVHGLERVPREQWPQSLYYYAPASDAGRLHRAMAAAGPGRAELALPQVRLGEGPMQGVRVLSVPPWTRVAQVRNAREPWLPHASDPMATLESASGGWVHISLGRRLDNGAQAHLNFELYRTFEEGSTAYVLRPTPYVQQLYGPNADLLLTTNFTITLPPGHP